MAKSLRRIALIVAVATALSKVAGLVRQQVIAAAFGVGAAYDAYNYAYVLPGFLLILLGGINGPFHSAMVSVLARRPRQEGAHVLAAINTIVGAGLIGVTLLLVLFADPLIDLVGPALDAERHRIAVLQLRWMAPMALLSGLIGLGFGALNAADVFWLPSVSPLLSSVAVIGGIGLLWWQLGSAITLPATAVIGGIVLAASTPVGAADQCLRVAVLRLRHAGGGGGPGLRQPAGADPPRPAVQCPAGAAAAGLRAPDGTGGPTRTDQPHPPGPDALQRQHAAAGGADGGAGGADRGPDL
jgi:putative peptidoglycan lipid II flippase